MAMELTFPEFVSESNLERMRALVSNGKFKYPGASSIKTKEGETFLLKNKFIQKRLEGLLQPGDIVNRHLMDGDYVLFNRQPSLHRQSIMAFQV